MSGVNTHCDSYEKCLCCGVCYLQNYGLANRLLAERLRAVYIQGVLVFQRNVSRPLISWDLFIFKKIDFRVLCTTAATTLPYRTCNFLNCFPEPGAVD